MSETIDDVRRQWVSMPGSSCDVRYGAGLLERSGKLFRDTVGTPRVCLLVVQESVSEELAERVRRQVVGAGFEASRCDIVAERSVEKAMSLMAAFLRAHVTSDDLVCVVGDADAISVASYACSQWCGGTPLVAVPMDAEALLEGVVVPRPLSVADEPDMVHVKPCAKRAVCDPEVMHMNPESDASRLARVLMVATAMCESERAFSGLWDNADKIMAGDEDVWASQLLEAAKGRGHLVSSTSLAIRQSAGYGRTFAAALENIAPGAEPLWARMSEGLRFSARVSAGLGKLSVDDMLAQDDLLSMLGVDRVVAIAPQPKQLVESIRQERFRRSNRFLLDVPQAIGRVRLAAVDDDMLADHASAWCEAHAQRMSDDFDGGTSTPDGAGEPTPQN